MQAGMSEDLCCESNIDFLTMELWTAFLLGLLGSLHCAGMCGPLALAIPVKSNSMVGLVFGRLAYNLGRVTTYSLLGALFGLAGQSVAVLGLQRWLSVAAGILILIAVVVGARMSSRPIRAVDWLKSLFAKLLHNQTWTGTYALGVLNGLLPCGLVYVACAAASTSAGLLSGMAYMIAFGTGTIPMMLAIGLAGKSLQFRLRFKLARFIPLYLIGLGVFLIVRGLPLPEGRPACCQIPAQSGQ
jgi:sulfite exporter TauE/SafE